MTSALIALGGNIPPEDGDIKQTFLKALETVSDRIASVCVKRSRWYATPAFPPGSGPDYLNAAAAFETALEPEALLAVLHGIEADLGRVRKERWAPRVCDIDLIAMEDRVLPDRETLDEWMRLDLGRAQTLVPPRLILPHPRMHERAFVLVPLADVAPDWRHPATGLTVREMLDALPAAELEAIRPIPD